MCGSRMERKKFKIYDSQVLLVLLEMYLNYDVMQFPLYLNGYHLYLHQVFARLLIDRDGLHGPVNKSMTHHS